MAEKLIRSAVVILETPSGLMLQERPNLPGKLAYPGKKQFLGGHVEEGEDPKHAAARELGEETSLDVSSDALTEHWSGEYVGEGKNGELVPRHVSVFYLGLTALGRDTLQLKEGGELAHIPKTPEGIEAVADTLTPFALERLREFVKTRATDNAPH